jgi:hypothetical protein
VEGPSPIVGCAFGFLKKVFISITLFIFLGFICCAYTLFLSKLYVIVYCIIGYVHNVVSACKSSMLAFNYGIK